MTMYKNIKSGGNDKPKRNALLFLLIGLAAGGAGGAGALLVFKKDEDSRENILDVIDNFYNDLKETDFGPDYKDQIADKADRAKEEIRKIVSEYNDKAEDTYDYTAEELAYFESLVDDTAAIVETILDTMRDYQRGDIAKEDLSRVMSENVRDRAANDDISSNKLEDFLLDWANIPDKYELTGTDIETSVPTDETQINPNTSVPTDQPDTDPEPEATQPQRTEEIKPEPQRVDPGQSRYNELIEEISETISDYSVNENNTPEKIVADAQKNLTEIDREVAKANQELESLDSDLRLSQSDVRQKTAQYINTVGSVLINKADEEYQEIINSLEDEYVAKYQGTKVPQQEREDYFEEAADKFISIKEKYDDFSNQLGLTVIRGQIAGEMNTLADVHQFWMSERDNSFPESVVN